MNSKKPADVNTTNNDCISKYTKYIFIVLLFIQIRPDIMTMYAYANENLIWVYAQFPQLHDKEHDDIIRTLRCMNTTAFGLEATHQVSSIVKRFFPPSCPPFILGRSQIHSLSNSPLFLTHSDNKNADSDSKHF